MKEQETGNGPIVEGVTLKNLVFNTWPQVNPGPAVRAPATHLASTSSNNSSSGTLTRFHAVTFKELALLSVC